MSATPKKSHRLQSDDGDILIRFKYINSIQFYPTTNIVAIHYVGMAHQDQTSFSATRETARELMNEFDMYIEYFG